MKSFVVSTILLFFCVCAFAQTESSGQVHPDSIKISLSDTLGLNEVVVTAQKVLVKTDLDKITYDMANDEDAKTNNLLEMLKKVPMVTVDGEENVQLKGSSSFKYYINGKPSNLLSNNPKDVLKSMPANTVKSIEVITDPGAKYDAEGVTGIINIITVNNSSMGGYTVSFTGNVDHRGNLGGGTYFSVKQGKVGLTGNLNAGNTSNSPKYEFSNFRKDFVRNTELTQTGWGKNKYHHMYGYGELSYEIDTLRLLSVSYNQWGYGGESDNYMEVAGFNSYKQQGVSTNSSTSPSVRADYQRSFADVKDRLLTFSYNLYSSPEKSSSEVYLDELLNNKQASNGSTNEHTFQLDYTTPINKIHTIEAGVKYIKRINKSDSEHSIWNNVAGWIPLLSDNDKFRHNSDILAAYAGYNVKLKKWGFKAGVRFEGTWLKAEFDRNEAMNFDADYTNLVPSTTVTYQLKQGQTLRAGYNLRIQRPGIWYLNPYRNTTDTANVSFGNPNLDAVKYHNFTLNYSYFNPKFTANANLSYQFADNTIQDYVWIENNTAYTTYKNIGNSRNIGLSTYFNWSPTSKFRINANLNGSYSSIKANSVNLSNEGFRGNAYSNIQYTLPKDFMLSFYGNYSSPWIGLQGKGNSWYYYGFAASKSMLKKNLTVRASVNNPFLNIVKSKSTTATPEFYMENMGWSPRTNFSLSVSYRFGEMKAQIKKVSRSIQNDDNMSGGNSGGSGGQQGGGN
jgi:outer membrane receptor protein involved in Fe transport